MNIPDGAICVKRGHQNWTCLVEVLTGTAPITTEQLESDLELARLNGFDTALTISNRIRSDPSELPYEVNGSSSEGFGSGIAETSRRGSCELIRTWMIPSQGAGGLEGMGDAWVEVRQGHATKRLARVMRESTRTPPNGQQFAECLGLQFSPELGVAVRNQAACHRSPTEPMDASYGPPVPLIWLSHAAREGKWCWFRRGTGFR